ncbi:hypothetical protein MRB53_021758 [Persea americana]|uniref:Uncharacterized protein n=1 Tax=Persea americana TaxID=3435 RepID=A0ACC2L4L0_PERAE|nr:hypothetical protein MRB53_021758 [Persea americana]
MAGGLIRRLIWLAYLLADVVATFSLGQLSNTNLTPNNKGKSMGRTYDDKYNDLMAFWAPFLLLHLGGPDTITAFALEDNELWLRHFLYLGAHLFAGGYVFMRSFPNDTLVIPTLLLFMAGTIKYLERTMALYLASNVGFKGTIPKVRDPGTNYKVLMDEYMLNKDAGLPSKIEIPAEYPALNSIEEMGKGTQGDNNIEIVAKACEFFMTFKRIIIDLLLNFNERKKSRDYLLKLSAEEAFTMTNIELGLVYDILYTKAAIIHRGLGYATHSICFLSILAAFFLFMPLHAHELQREDILVTYSLLGSALILELVGLVRLIFSPWTYTLLTKKNNSNLIARLIGKFIIWHMQPIYISRYNLINSCVYDHRQFKCIRNISQHWCFAWFRDQFMLLKNEPIDNGLMGFIFHELKRKSMASTDFNMVKHLGSCRGSWVLEQRACYTDFCWTFEVEFEQSILLWHIATDLCFQVDNCKDQKTPSTNLDSHGIHFSTEELCHFGKLISEYMLYLLVLYPSMISSMEGIRQIKKQEAYEEVMCYIDAENKTEESVRKILLSLSSRMEHKPNLVLFDACYLLRMLNILEKRRKWEIISEVWAELLSYAASHCRGKHHVECLIRGGELLTHVWFLMAQMGLGQQYHLVSSHARAKLNVNLTM